MVHILWASLAIPIAIHLVHRRKARRILFSTLRFLRLVDHRVARRQRLRELILLALRCLLLAAIVGALYHKAIGPFRGARAQTAVAIVLDNTYSMRACSDGVMRFARARKAAAQILSGLQDGDSACVVPACAPPDDAPDMTTDLGWLRGELDRMQCGFGAARVMRSVRLAAQSLEACTAERKELYLISDFQQVAWPDPDEEVEALPEDVATVLVDVGGPEGNNLTLGKAQFGFNVQVAGLACDLYCSVGNAGTQPLEKELTFLVGADKVKERTVSVPPGDEREVSFRHAFRRPGETSCEVRLAPDDLDADNARFVVVTVREVPVLLVNGRPSPVHYMAETFYLERALRATTGKAEVISPIKVSTIEADALAGSELADYACVVLANVPEIADPDALDRYVRGGGGLIIFAGDQVDPAAYGKALGTGDDGLLPAELLRARDRSENEGERPFRITRLAHRHPVFRGVADSITTETARVRRFFAVSLHPQAVVMAELDGGPLLIERAVGDGLVILCTTSGDRDWNNLPMRLSFFVPVLHQMVYHAARSARRAPSVHVGAPLEVPEADGKVVSWYGPPLEEGGEEQLLGDDLDETAPNMLKTTRRPGVHRAICTRADGGESTRLFAVNVDPRESNPARVAAEEAGKLIGAPGAIIVRKVERLAYVARRRREGLPIWDYLFIAAIVVAVAESFVGNVMLKR